MNQLRRVAVAWTFVACAVTGAWASEPASGMLAAVKARGKLVMVCFPHQDNPFVHVNVAEGAMKKVGTAADFQGVDVDLMSKFAASLGVTLEIRPIATPSYGELIPALLAGNGDVIASSFSVTAERAAQIDFTVPYFEVYQAVLARRGSALAKVDDLAGKTAAVAEGSAMEGTVRALGFPDDRIRRQGFTRDVLLEVANGGADFAVLDEDDYGTGAALLKEFPALEVKFKIGKPESYAFAVPKGSDLKPALDAFVAKEKSSGDLARLIRAAVKKRK